MAENAVVENKVVEIDGKWYVKSKDGSKNLGGPYDSEPEAKKRLREVEYFKHNQFVTMKSTVTPVVRNDRMEGRDWLVVPMVMLVEGVHNGSCGALYYPKDELAKTPQVWNYKPIVVYHPNGPTACDPDVLTNRKIGVIMNTRFEDDKLKAEAWLDAERMGHVDNRVAEAIANGQMMELSTGLFTDNEGPAGEWNSEHYDAVAKNYRPDHLAVLPDQMGACSTADGAGFMRLNAEKNQNRIAEGWADTFFPFLEAAGIDTQKLVANEMSHSTIWGLLEQAVQKANAKAWLNEVFDSFFIYSVDGQVYKQGYEVTEKDDSVTLVGVAEPAIRVVQYKTKTGTFKANNFKDLDMNKTELIAKLIGNKESGWTDADKGVLEGMTEVQLTTLTQKIDNQVAAKKEREKVMKEEEEQKVKKNAEQAKPVVADAKASGDAVVVNTEKKEESKQLLTLNEALAQMPVEMQRVLRQGMAAYNAEKNKLIGVIKANKQNVFTDEFLNGQELEVLQGLAKLAVVPDVQQSGSVLQQPFNYSGQADTAQATNKAVTPLELPVMNFDQK